MHIGWWETLVHYISAIPVTDNAVLWNCQDYAIEIWDLMLTYQMIDEGTWTEGQETMLQYYGQDFGGQREEEDEVDDDDDEEQGLEGQRGHLSEEFVYDSSEDT